MTPLEIFEARSSRMPTVRSAAVAAPRATRTARPAAPTWRARKYRPGGEHGHRTRRGHRGRSRDQALRRPRGAARRELRGAPGERLAVIGPNGAGKTTLLSILAGVCSRRPAAPCSRDAARGRLGAPAAGGLREAQRSPRTCGCSRAWRASPTPTPSSRGCSSRRAWASAPATSSGRCRAATASASTSPSACSADPPRAAARRAVVVAGPAPARAAVGVHRALARGGDGGRLLDAQRRRGRALRRPRARARRRRAALRRHAGRAARRSSAATPATSRRPSSRFLHERGHWCRCAGCCSRTCGSCAARRCWSAVLVAYPVIISVLIGLALSRGPDKPRVAIVNELPAGADELLGRQPATSTSTATPRSCSSPSTRSRSTRARRRIDEGALGRRRSARSSSRPTSPASCRTRSTSPGSDAAHRRGPLQRRRPAQDAAACESTIKSRLADANKALSDKLTEIAARYLAASCSRAASSRCWARSSTSSAWQRSKAVARATLRHAAAGLRAGARRCSASSTSPQLAIENLDLSDEVLAAVGQPLQVKRTVIAGHRTPLDAFAVVGRGDACR